VYTDNSAVASILKAKEPSGRLFRWIHFLGSYDLDIKHRHGKDNVVADYLSRNPILTVKKLNNVEQLQAIHNIFASNKDIKSRDLKLLKNYFSLMVSFFIKRKEN
jgi:hypothetical protein